MPGSATATRSSADWTCALRSTDANFPPATDTRTSRAQPSGNSARSQKMARDSGGSGMRASIRGRIASSGLPLAGRGTHLYGSPMRCDRIWRNARLATMTPSSGLGIVEDGLVACRDGDIVYAGPTADAPAALDSLEVVDCQRRWITPRLIDCHTHLVYAGDRTHEFEQRLNGVSYEAIARAGGGIRSTMHATRAA